MYCILTWASPLQHKNKVPTEGAANFRANLLDLRSLGNLHSSEIEPTGSIHLSSGAAGRETAWCTLPRKLKQSMVCYCK